MLWRPFLLGALSEAEQERLELALLTSEASAHDLADAEDELVEDYLGGVLSAAEHASFETHFLLSPEHRQSLEASRLLRDTLRQRAHPNARRQPAMAVWASLLAAAIAFVTFNLYRKVEAPTVPPRAVASGPTSTAVPRTDPPRVAMLSLAPGRVMAQSANARVTLAPNTDLLRLELLVEDAGLVRCRVTVAAREHGDVWTSDVVQAVRMDGGATVTVDVPTAKLGDASDYEALVRKEPGREKSGTYAFMVVRP
jgi:hypothetical protein